MSEKELRRSRAILPIGVVMELTDLTARQIRYYEEKDLVMPLRSTTNRRLFSLNDIDRLLEIKDFLEDGLSIEAIKRHYHQEKISKQSFMTSSKQVSDGSSKALTDEDVRRIFYNEIMQISRLSGNERPF
ncbi:MerR family transcriptional regulator, glutamine synthetase repressor/oligopeptide transport system substrate-binding protein [Granulicatella balaenopterae]|uniref:MerR family transcriptional regulator, glutamine synthetase repressor/oligopeptide transport system substrate-binding protein n=1 Tax=Granulicatella balaenopterae TaxID=137733 RepID=A0A1H9JKA7_9LACT|nr:MerR family transcriptional regulator [Granulicatella balaenopterae]SEQ87431.1 MerR family transcriptional regulator, glutamine synthetase repressor/oligopeptide transport system substrate-binding protein [Granulicatella balaenopterae]